MLTDVVVCLLPPQPVCLQMLWFACCPVNQYIYRCCVPPELVYLQMWFLTAPEPVYLQMLWFAGCPLNQYIYRCGLLTAPEPVYLQMLWFAGCPLNQYIYRCGLLTAPEPVYLQKLWFAGCPLNQYIYRCGLLTAPEPVYLQMLWFTDCFQTIIFTDVVCWLPHNQHVHRCCGLLASPWSNIFTDVVVCLQNGSGHGEIHLDSSVPCTETIAQVYPVGYGHSVHGHQVIFNSGIPPLLSVFSQAAPGAVCYASTDWKLEYCYGKDEKKKMQLEEKGVGA